MKKVFTFLMCLVLVTQVFGAMRTYERNGLYYAREDYEASGEYLAYVAGPDDEDENQSYAGLTSVVIPDTVVFDGIVYTVVGIYDEAFLDCQNLASVTFSNSLRTIGGSAFRGCTGLDSIVIPNGVISIGNDAFNGCSGLASIVLPASRPWIGENAFYGCNNLTLIIATGATEISGSAFSGCDFKAVVIPEGVKTIGQDAFRECHNLVSVSLPSTLETIGNKAFNECAIDSIVIPASVKTIADNAFDNCRRLKTVVFEGAVENFGTDVFYVCDSLKYNKYGNCRYLGNTANPYLLLIKAEIADSHRINDSTKSIVYRAFSDIWDEIDSLAVPAGVKYIGNYAFEHVKNLYYKGSATGSPWGAQFVNPVFDGDFIFSGEEKTILAKYTGEDSEITIPDGVVEIGKYAFENKSITSVTMTNSVKTIGERAFEWCSNLKTVVLSDSLESIGENAFAYCRSLSTTTIPDGVSTIGNYAFENVLDIQYHGTASGSPWGAKTFNAFADGDFLYSDSTKTEIAKYSGTDSVVTIPAGVTEIGSEAFKENQYIKSVVMDSALESIANNAFCDCRNLQSVSLNDGLKSIGSYSFANCRNLKEITIPDGVETIDYSAFSDGVQYLYYNGIADGSPWGATFVNPAIENGFVFTDSTKTVLVKYIGTDSVITIPAGVTEIGTEAFRDNDYIKTVVMDSALESIAINAFCDCRNLQSVSLNDGLKSIGSYSFASCRNLKEITIPDGVETIDYLAFSDGVQYIFYNGTADGSPWGARFVNPTIDGDFIYSDSTKTVLNLYLGSDSEVTIPNGVVEISERAFAEKSQLTSVVIPETVKTIGNNAFCNCGNLRNVQIPSSIETVGYGLFYWSWNVTIVCDFASKPDSWPWDWNGDGNVVWKKAPLSITIYSSEYGTVTGYNPDSTYHYGDTLTLTATANPGYYFDRWSDWEYENPRTIIVDNNIELSAEFYESQPVDVSVRSKNTFLGTVAGFDPDKTYYPGDTLKLTATPVGEFGFMQWSDGNTDNPRTIIVDGETTLVAEFEEPFELADNSGWGSIGSFAELTKNDDGKTTQVDLSFSNSGNRWDAQFVTPSLTNLGNEGDAFELSFDVKYSGEFEYGQPTIVAGKTIPYNAEYDQANNTQIVDEYGYSLSWGRDFYAEKEWTRVSYNYYLGAEGADSVRLEFDLGSYAGTYSFKNIVLKVAGNTADKWFCSGDAFISATAAYGTVTGSGFYNNGDTVMLTATPNSGYKFKQWSDGNTDNPRVVAVDGDATYTAELEPIYYSSADFPFNTWWTSDCQADSVQFDSSLAAKIFVSEDQANGNSWDAQFCNIFHELDGQTEGNYVKVSFDVYFDGEADTAVVKFLTGKLTWSLNPDIHEDYQYSSNNTEILDEYGSGIIWRTFEIEKGRWQTITVEGTIGEAGANYIGIELDLGGNANNVGDFYFRNMTMTVGGNVATKDYFDSNKVLVNLSANIANSGYLSGAGFYNIGDTVTLTATANKGYTFKQWSDGNTNATRTITVTSDTVINAIFDKAETLTVYAYSDFDEFGKWFSHGILLDEFYTNQNNEAVIKVDDAGNAWDAQFCNIFHEANGQAEGNSFSLDFDVMWEGNNADTTAINILAGKSYGNFHADYQWNSYDDTTNVVKNTELIYEGGFWAGHNKEYRLPYGEWKHITWGGTIGKAGADYIGLQINLADTAGRSIGTYRFKNIVVKINGAVVSRKFYNGNANLLVSASGENGTVTGGGYYGKGDEVKLTATPNEGYLFKQWSDGNTRNPRTITVNGNMTFVAEFVVDDSKPIPYFAESDSLNTWFVDAWKIDKAYVKDNIASIFISEYDDEWSAQFCNILTGLDGQEVGNNFQLDFDVNWNGLESDKATIYLLAGKVMDNIHDDYQWSDSIAELVNSEGTIDGIRYAGYDLANSEWTHVSWGGIITETGAKYIGIEINLNMKEENGDNRGTFNFKNMKVRINGEVVKQDFCTGELLVNATAGENGTVNGAGFYTKGDTATITAIADEYYYFKQWSDGNTDNPRTFVVNDDMSFSAEFATNAVNIPYYAESDSINAWYVNGSLVKKAITADNIASITVSENGNLWESQFCNILSGLDGQEAGSKFQLDFDVNWNSLSGADKAQIMMVTGKSGYGDRYSDDENTELVNDNGNFNGIQYATYQIANKSWTHISWGGTIGEKGADYIGVGIYFNKFDEEADKRGTFNFKNMKVRINGEVVKQDFCTGELFVNATAKNGTVTGAGYYTKGDTATLAVTPYDGCIFKQWSDGNTDNPRTFVVTDDASFVAEIEREEVNYTSADYPFNTWWTSGSTADSVQMGASGYAAKISISEEQAEGDRWDVQFCNIFHQFDGQVEGNNVKLSFDVKFEGAADTATITFVTGKITWSLNPEIHEDYQWTDDNTEIVDEYGYMVRSLEYDIEKGKWQNITIEGKIGEKGAKYIGIELDLAGNAGNTNNVGDFYFKNMTLSVNGNIVTSDYEVIENTKKSVLVIANDKSYGYVSGSGDYNLGDTVTATATATDGCEFIGWSDGSTSNPYSFVVTKDVKLTANFQKKAVVVETFTVSVAADSTLGSAFGDGIYSRGDTATITAIANDGFEFIGWSDGSTANPYSFVVTKDVKLTANFQKKAVVVETFTVSVAADSTFGSVRGAGTYKLGDTATITAIANDDYEFTGWSDGSTANPYSFVVTKDVKLTANFQKKAVVVETFTVSVAADSTFGSVRGAGTYKLGDTATIVALENDGYEFTGWSDGNTNAVRTIVVTADVKLTALFSKKFNPERTVDGLVFFLTDTTAHTADLIGLADSRTGLDAPAEIKIEGVAYQVTGIGNKAFAGCTQLDSINIPESIETIGIEAFANCTGTVSIVIPNTVDSIGYNAFLNVKNIVYEGNATGSPWGALTVNGTFDGDYIYDTDSSLTVYTGSDTVVVIPDEVSTIGHNAFAGNETVTSIEIPETVTEIGDGAFNGCSNLESVEIPKSVESIGNETFANCTSLESVEIPESVKEIGGSAFNGCSSLTAIQIPVSVTVIGQSAFANCSKLDAVEIPESVNELGNGAFTNCTSLVSVSIPVSVTVIGAETFSGCSSLNNIEIPSATTEIGNNAFDGCSSLTTISIPVSVTTIGNGAFAYCNSLVTVQIGTFINVKNEGVSTLADGSVSIGSRAFIGCDSLTAVYIPLSVASIGDSAFAGCKNLTIYCEAESMPGGWSKSWNPEGCKVVWNYNGKPQVVEFNLIAIANNSRFGSVTGSATYTKGATATITATAAEGYKFVGWSDGNTDNPRTVVVTGDLAFTAVFEAVTAIDDEAAAAVNIFAYSNTIVVENADSNISVYDANGRLIATEQPAGQRTEILIANKGVYLVKVGSTAKRVMVF